MKLRDVSVYLTPAPGRLNPNQGPLRHQSAGTGFDVVLTDAGAAMTKPPSAAIAPPEAGQVKRSFYVDQYQTFDARGTTQTMVPPKGTLFDAKA